MGDEYRPREHDHLVEPVFGGLGVRDEGTNPPAKKRGPWAALARWLRLLFARLRKTG